MNTTEDGTEPESGSLDNRPPRIVNVQRETVLAILVFPDGTVDFATDQSTAWVAETLQTLTDSVKAKLAKET